MTVAQLSFVFFSPLADASVQHAFTWRLDKTRTYLAKDSKKSDPQDEKDPIPGGNKDGASLNDEGNEVESACGCRQGANYNGIDLW
jgi:hypothetical protein